MLGYANYFVVCLLAGFFALFLASLIVEIGRKPSITRMQLIREYKYYWKNWAETIRPKFVGIARALYAMGYILVFLSVVYFFIAWAYISYAL